MAEEGGGVLSSTMRGFNDVQMSIYEQVVSIASIFESIVTGSLESLGDQAKDEEIQPLPTWELPSLPELTMPEHKEISCLYTGAAAFALTMLIFALMTFCYVRLKRRSKLKHESALLDADGKVACSHSKPEPCGENDVRAGSNGSCKSQGGGAAAGGDGGGENRIRYQPSTVDQSASCYIDGDYVQDINDSRVTTALTSITKTGPVGIQVVVEKVGKNVQRGYTMDSPERRARSKTDNRSISQKKSVSSKKGRIFAKWSLGKIKRRMNAVTKGHGKLNLLTNEKHSTTNARQCSAVHLSNKSAVAGAPETFHQTKKTQESSHEIKQNPSKHGSSRRCGLKQVSHKQRSGTVSPRTYTNLLASETLHKSSFAYNRDSQENGTGSFNAITQNGNGRIKIKTDWSAFLTSVQEKLHKTPEKEKKNPKKSSPLQNASSHMLKNSEICLVRKIKKRGHLGHVKKSGGGVDKIDSLKSIPKTSGHNAGISKLVEAVKPTQSTDFSGEVTLGSYTIRKTIEPMLSSLKGKGAFSSYTKEGKHIVSTHEETRYDCPSVAHGDLSDGKDSIMKECCAHIRDTKARSPLGNRQKLTHSEKFSRDNARSGNIQGAAHENIGRHNTKFLIERGQTSSNEISTANGRYSGTVSEKQIENNRFGLNGHVFKDVCNLNLSKGDYFTFREVKIPALGRGSKPKNDSGKKAQTYDDKDPGVKMREAHCQMKEAFINERPQEKNVKAEIHHVPQFNFGSGNSTVNVPSTFHMVKTPKTNVEFKNGRDQLQFIASSNSFLNKNVDELRHIHKPYPSYLCHSSKLRDGDVATSTSNPVTSRSNRPNDNICHSQEEKVLKISESRLTKMSLSTPHNLQFICVPHEAINCTLEVSSNQEHGRLEPKLIGTQTVEEPSEKNRVAQERRAETHKTGGSNEYNHSKLGTTAMGQEHHGHNNYKSNREDNDALSSFTIKSAFGKIDRTVMVAENMLFQNQQSSKARDKLNERACDESLRSRPALICENLEGLKKSVYDVPFNLAQIVPPDSMAHHDQSKTQHRTHFCPDKNLHPIAESGDFAHRTKTSAVQCHNKCEASVASTSESDVTTGCFQIEQCYFKGERHGHWALEPSDGVTDHANKRDIFVQENPKHQKERTERLSTFPGDDEKEKSEHNKCDYNQFDLHRNEDKRKKSNGYPVKKSKSLISVGQMVSELTSKSHQKLNPGQSPVDKTSSRKHTKICKVIYVKPSHRICRHLRVNTAPKTKPEPIFLKISNHDFLQNRKLAYHEHEKRDDYVKYCKLRKVRCHRHEPYKKQLVVTSSGSTTPPSGHVAYHKRNRNNCSPSRRGRFVLGPKVDHQCFEELPKQPQHTINSDDPSSDSFAKAQSHEREGDQKPEGEGLAWLRQNENADTSSCPSPPGISEGISQENKSYQEKMSTDEYVDKYSTGEQRKKLFYNPGIKGENVSSVMADYENGVKKEACPKIMKNSAENLEGASKLRSELTTENINHTSNIDKKTTAALHRENRKRGRNRIPTVFEYGYAHRISKGIYEDQSNRKPFELNSDPINPIVTGLDVDSSYSDLKTKDDDSRYQFCWPREKYTLSKSPPTTRSHMTQTEPSNLLINIGIQTSPRLETRPRKMLFQYKRKGCNNFPKSWRDKAKIARKSKASRIKFPCKKVIDQGDQDICKNPVAQWLQDHTFVNWTHLEQSSQANVTPNEIATHVTTRTQSSTLVTSDWASNSFQSPNVTQTTKVNINLDTRPGWASHKKNSTVTQVRSKQISHHAEEAKIATEHIGDCPHVPVAKDCKDKPQEGQPKGNETFQFRGFSFDQRQDPASFSDRTEPKSGIQCQSSLVPRSNDSEDNKASVNRPGDKTSTSSIAQVHSTNEEASETSMTSSRLSELQKLCVIRPFWKNANIDEIDRRVKRALRLREELQMSRSTCGQRRAKPGGSLVGTFSISGHGDVDNNNAVKSGEMVQGLAEKVIVVKDEVRWEHRDHPQTIRSDIHGFENQLFKVPRENTLSTRVPPQGKEFSLGDNKNKSPDSLINPLNSNEKAAKAGQSTSGVCRQTNIHKDGKVEKSQRLEHTPRLERSLSFHEDPVCEMESRPGKASSEHTSSRPSNSNSAQNTLKRARARDKNSPPTKISKVENALTSTPKLVGELVQSLPQVPLFSFVEWFIETSDPSNFVVSDHSSSSSGKDREERIFRDEVNRAEELGCLVKYHGRNFKLNQGSFFEGMPDTPSTATFAISSRTAEDQTTFDFESLTPTDGLSADKRFGHLDTRLHDHQQQHHRSREIEDDSGLIDKCPLQAHDTDDTAPSLPRRVRSKNFGYKFGDAKENCPTPFRFSMTEPNSTSSTDPSHSKSSYLDTNKTSESSVKTPTVHLAYDSYLHKKMHLPDNDTTSSAGTKTGDLSDLYNIYCNIRDNDDPNEDSPKREGEWPVDSTEESVTGDVYVEDRPPQVFVADKTDDDVDRCAPGIRHILMKLRQTKDGDDTDGPRHDRTRITLRKSSDVTGIIAKFQNENS